MLNQLKYRILAFVLLVGLGLSEVMAQDVLIPKAQRKRENLSDTLKLKDLGSELDSVQLVILQNAKDSLARLDSILNASKKVPVVAVDTLVVPKIKEPFIPDPKKALWYAIAFPGGGQIYNRKYWKLPIVYGGFLGCYYALSWNNNMYRDYSQAYIDIMATSSNSKSYMNFLPKDYDVEANKERLKDIFRRKKDFYRRYRDMSFFCMLGVYGLSIIDAYVDAELSSFDISNDLSLKIKPAIIRDNNNFMAAHGMTSNTYGIGCSIDF